MTTAMLKPTAKVSVKKSVLKVYRVKDVNTVYLKDGAEFEIELFNGTQDVLLAKFTFNGKQLEGGGIVLHPGERIFLERYLTENKKFKFETYIVDNSPEVEAAIAKNGLLEVKFFKEEVKVTPIWINSNYTTAITTNSPFVGATFTGTLSSNASYTATYDSSFMPTSLGVQGTVGPAGDPGVQCFYNATTEKETGRISKGNYSSQNFSYVDMNFYDTYSFIETIKILPESEKLFEASDLKHRLYCHECGKKVKPTDKFCSNCGTKL